MGENVDIKTWRERGGQDQHGTTHIDEGGQASNESKKVKCKSPTAREHTHTNTLSTEYVGKDSQHFFSYARTHAHARTDTRLPHYSFVSRNATMSKGARKNPIGPAKKVSRGRTEANACRRMGNSQEVVAL